MAKYRIFKSSITGQFVKAEEAAADPERTYGIVRHEDHPDVTEAWDKGHGYAEPVDDDEPTDTEQADDF